MQLLADENVPAAAVRALQAAGHDVVWIRAVATGSKDPEIFARAQLEKRIIVTFDKDFGELAVGHRLSVLQDCCRSRLTQGVNGAPRGRGREPHPHEAAAESPGSVTRV